MKEEDARGSQGEPAADTNSAQHNDEPLSGRQKRWLVLLVILKRVRFLAILAGVGVFIGNWDAVKLHWDRWTHPHSAAVRQVPAGKEFFCPMDPQVTRSSYEPNGDAPICPICGMPLSLHDHPAEEALPPGVTGRVTLSPERVVMAGIKTITIGYRPMSRLTKSMGYVICDESRVSHVVGRVDGYVEKLYVDKTFTRVRKGDPLAEIHSPQLYSAARELVLAAVVLPLLLPVLLTSAVATREIFAGASIHDISDYLLILLVFDLLLAGGSIAVFGSLIEARD